MCVCVFIYFSLLQCRHNNMGLMWHFMYSESTGNELFPL